MTRLEQAGAIVEIASAAILAASLTVAVFAYISQKEEQKLQFTIQLTQPYLSGELQDEKDTLFYKILAIQQSVAPAKLGPSDLGTYLEKSGDVTGSDNKELSAALLAISSFFNSARRCADSKMCDPNLMESLIGADAQAIRCVFGGYLAELERSANVEGLRSGIDFFSEGKCR